VLHAIPVGHPQRFRTLDAARHCLGISEKFRPDDTKHNIYIWVVYCHWMLLDAPLTPFTTVFCNIVTYPETSHGDLRLLEDFVESLRPGVALSDGIRRFHRLCSLFTHLAQTYVQAKRRSHSVSNGLGGADAGGAAIGIGEFNEHLAALGFLGLRNSLSDSVSEEPHEETAAGSRPFCSPGLLDFQSGPDALYDLLDQDLGQLAYFETLGGSL
jgi:hypothetical protein